MPPIFRTILMNLNNPYQPTSHSNRSVAQPQKAAIGALELIRQGYEFIREQYWMFFAITLVGMLIGNAVPLGLVMGPMLVGINLCFLALQRGERVAFATLFDGFDDFKESLIATLILIAATVAVIIPLIGIAVVGILIVTSSAPNAAGNEQVSIGIAILMLVIYVLAIIACVLVTVPFLFAFHLIAEQKLSGLDAVTTSFRGVRRNAFGILRYVIVVSIISFVLMIMCYVPFFFFMPIAFSSLFLLYRKVFPQTPEPAR
jgi:uncharacterized membrane protein